MFGERDRAAALFLMALPAAMAAAVFVSGRTVFWGDLTYLHHPWRALAAEYAARGMAPLWNPYAYLGMPLAAQMQCAAWYPGTLLFHLFSFETATAVFHGLHFGLAGVFAFLWLRRIGLRRTASLGGALVFMGAGAMVSRLPFLNHLSSLAFVPSFLLLGGTPWLLGLALALSFLSGYPTILAGGAAAALALPLLLRSSAPRAGTASPAAGRPGSVRGAFRNWGLAGIFAAGAGACLLVPAARLFGSTHRGGGLDLSETLRFGLAPADWVQWISPLLVPRGGFSAATLWWKDCYIGLAAWTAVAASAARLRTRAAAALASCVAATALLMLGDSTRVSLWAWGHWPPLRYIRYPGNLAFLALPALALLAACGLHRRRWSRLGAAAIAAELACYVIGSQPVIRRGFFAEAGPLVRELQASLGGHRYLLSGMSLQTQAGAGPTEEAGTLDWKRRLYGLTNVPFHLRAAGNFGEPLTPSGSYDFMDFMYRRPGLDAVAPFLPWADVRVVLARDRLASGKLAFRGRTLWNEYWDRPPGLRTSSQDGGRAYWFDEAAGAALPAAVREDLPAPDIRAGRPLDFAAEREDRFRVRGRTPPGWVYLAEPRAEGWRFWLNGRPVGTERAMTAFQKLRIPGGELDLRCRYDPASWRLGLLATVLVLLGASAYWYNRTLAALNDIGSEVAGG